MQTPIRWKMGQVIFLMVLVLGLVARPGSAPQGALAQQEDTPTTAPTETAETAPTDTATPEPTATPPPDETATASPPSGPTLAVEIDEPAATDTPAATPPATETVPLEPTTTPSPTATAEATVTPPPTEIVEPTVTPLPAEIVEPDSPATSPAEIVEPDSPPASPTLSPPPVAPGPEVRPIVGRPLLFIENVGQYAASAGGEPIRFQVNSRQATLSLTDTALWFTLLEPSQADTSTQSSLAPDSPISNLQSPISTPQRGLNLKLSFINANPRPRIEPFRRLDTTVSYFIGNDPARWQANVPAWAGVRYVDLYPGLDLEITAENGQLVQRLVIKDGAAAAQTSAELSALSGVRLRVEGAEAMTLDDSGLYLTTALGDVSLPLLQAITAGGAPVNPPALTPEVQGFEVASPFSPASQSPGPPAEAGIAAAGALVYSTFIGGTPYADSSQDIALDGANNVYITGRAYMGFPSTPGVFDPTIEGNFVEGFVARLTPDGSGLAYATFIGGSNFDWTFGIDVDQAGNAYVTGFTGSSDFPATPGAFDSTLASELDAFVAKINPTGTALLYATLLGGNNDEYGYDVAVGDGGQAYVTGFTRSTDFPTTPDALAPRYKGGFSDGFAVKVAADGSALTYATYLGGSADESGEGIAVDGSGNAYVTGYTGSADFPTTPDAWDTSLAVADAFVLKLNPAGSGLVYGTFIGGELAEVGRAIVLDSAGSAYITGRTDSRNFPATPHAFDTSYNSAGNDAFVARLAPDGRGLLYATYLGGNNEEEGQDLAVDAAGNVYVTGPTWSSDFPTTSDAYDSSCGGCFPPHPIHRDVFIAKLNPTGTGLSYGTYLGGDSDNDQSYGIAQDGSSYVYVTGDAESSDFPTTPGAYDTTLEGFSNGFVSKLFIGTGSAPPPPLLPEHSCAPTFLDTFTVQNEPRGLAVDPARQRLYVANFRSNSVSVVDTRNDNVIQTISGLDSANGLAYDPVHNLIWVTNYNSDQVTPIQANGDATGFTVLPPLAAGDGPWGVAYDPVHDFVYVVNNLGNSVTVINAAGRTVVASLSGSFSQPFHLAANPVNGKVYVSNFGNASVTVLNGATVSRVVSLYDSGQPYGIAVDEMRDLIYVATVGPHRIVALGPIGGVPDQFLGWAAFNRGFGDPRRPVPLRMIAVNAGLGPSFDGGHLWATTATSDASETNQALLIPKGWDSRFHIPFATKVGEKPGEGLAIDRLTRRVYVSGGIGLGTITVLGDSSAICPDAFARTAAAGEEVAGQDADQIGIEIFTNEPSPSEPAGQPDPNMPAGDPPLSDGNPSPIVNPVDSPAPVTDEDSASPRQTISGLIRLQGRADHSGTRLFLSEQPCAGPLAQSAAAPVAATDAQGHFELEAALGNRAAYLCAVQPGYLAGQESLAAANGGDLILPAGDLTGDNQIDITDAVLFASRYDTVDPTADLNADGRVDILDLVIIAANYARQGPETN